MARKTITALAVIGILISGSCALLVLATFFGGHAWVHLASDRVDKDRIALRYGKIAWHHEHWDDLHSTGDLEWRGEQRPAIWYPEYDGARGYVSITHHLFGFTYLAEPMTGFWVVVIPLGVPMVLFGLPSVGYFRHLWHKRRILTRGACAVCGYDLRASRVRCPECGTPLPAQEKG